jgi:hypothetical protein
MSDPFDWGDDYGIIKKSLTTSHLEVPEFAPEPVQSEPPPEPSPPTEEA